VIDGKTYAKIVFLGPDHRAGFSNCIFNNAKVWHTPLISTKVHKDAKSLLHDDLFQVNDIYDSNEHSLELVLPFLQFIIKSFEFIPVIMGQCDIPRVLH
jgi:AmmeMemoRadiSam system protein B